MVEEGIEESFYSAGEKRYLTLFLPSDVADRHYSAVSGLDDEFIYLQDPEIGSMRKLRREDFVTVWSDFTGKCIKFDELVVRQIIAVYR